MRGIAIWNLVSACNAAVFTCGVVAAILAPNPVAYFCIGFGLAAFMYTIVVIKIAGAANVLAVHARAMGQIMAAYTEAVAVAEQERKNAGNTTGTYEAEKQDHILH